MSARVCQNTLAFNFYKKTKPKALRLGVLIFYALERNEVSILVISLENFWSIFIRCST